VRTSCVSHGRPRIRSAYRDRTQRQIRGQLLATLSGAGGVALIRSTNRAGAGHGGHQPAKGRGRVDWGALVKPPSKAWACHQVFPFRTIVKKSTFVAAALARAVVLAASARLAQRCEEWPPLLAPPRGLHQRINPSASEAAWSLLRPCNIAVPHRATAQFTRGAGDGQFRQG